MKLIVLLFSNITSSWRHNDFVLKIWVQIWYQNIELSLYAEFQVIMLSIVWDIVMWSKKNEYFSTICQNKSDKKNEPVRVFQFCFQLWET